MSTRPSIDTTGMTPTQALYVQWQLDEIMLLKDTIARLELREQALTVTSRALARTTATKMDTAQGKTDTWNLIARGFLTGIALVPIILKLLGYL